VNLQACATRICRAVNTNLRAARSAGKIGKYPTVGEFGDSELGDTIAEVFFDGYYGGCPASVRVRFFHEKQRLAKPDIVTESPAHMRVYGSAKVASLLFNSDDARFAHLRKAKMVAENIDDGVQLAQSYFAACASPEAMEIDKRSCSAIGGHIHIAQITLRSGFEWIIPPKEGAVNFGGNEA